MLVTYKRWGEYDFCIGCEYRRKADINGYRFCACDKSINDRFPEHCNVPEREEFDDLYKYQKLAHQRKKENQSK